MIRLNTTYLNRIIMPHVCLPSWATCRHLGKKDDDVVFVEGIDEEIAKVLNQLGIVASPLGLTTEDLESITTFGTAFVGNEDLEVMDTSVFPNLVDCNIEQTTASIRFGDNEEETSTQSDEEVSQEEIDEYLNSL